MIAGWPYRTCTCGALRECALWRRRELPPLLNAKHGRRPQRTDVDPPLAPEHDGVEVRHPVSLQADDLPVEWPYFYAFDALSIDGEDLRARPRTLQAAPRRSHAAARGRITCPLRRPPGRARPRSLRARVRTRWRGHRSEVGARAYHLDGPSHELAEGENAAHPGRRPP